LFEGQRSIADSLMECVLYTILGLGSHEVRRKWASRGQGRGRCPPHFRPQVLGVAGMAAELERYEVILLVVRRRLVFECRRLELFPLERVSIRRRRTDCCRPA